MAVQILGLRPYVKKNETKTRLAEKFFEKGWRAKSVTDLFSNLEKHLDEIPEKERYNLFYTVSDCFETKGRKLCTQNIIPYDVDGIDLLRIDEYISPVLSSIGNLEFGDVGIVFSGSGLQFLVETDITIEDDEYFEETRPHYNAICARINKALKQAGLPGEADESVWTAARLMRLPGTKNIKTPDTGWANKNSVKEATVHQRMIICQPGYDIVKLVDLPKVAKDEQLDPEQLLRFPEPDNNAVLKECLFLQDCITNPNNVTEENWYKMLSVVGCLNDGTELAHSLSKGHKDYSADETDTKLEQAMLASGPRTCANIAKSSDKCSVCPYYKKLLSPILIKGPDHIATKATGFRNIKPTADGIPVPGKPNYEDILRYFKKQHDFFCLPSKILYIFNGLFWEIQSDSYLEAFVEDNVQPKPNTHECNEFKHKVYRNNLRDKEFLNTSTFKHVNLSNGVLDLSGDTPQLLPHSSDFGFLSVLPYGYDPDALCPRFDLFMEEITVNRHELVMILMEFIGYAFANERCVYAKAMVLLGGGANGKSTFMNVMKKLAGRGAYSAVSLARFDNDQYMAQLQGKLFNMTEETPTKAFADSSVFKNIVTGGDITVKVVYKEPYEVESRAKLIFACNELPWLNDTTVGMMRRLLIVPFDANFVGQKEDKDIELKLETELPGILNRVIQAYSRLNKNKRFTSGEITENEIDTYLEASDPVYRFQREYLDYGEFVVDKNTYTFAQDIYDAYRTFCTREGVHYVKEKIAFLMKLTTFMPQAKQRKLRKGQSRAMAYLGVTMNKVTEY